MKAIVVSKNGGPEVLEVVDKPVPAPQAGEALVKLQACGVNFIDVYHRRGTYPMQLPYVPGLEGAGIVEATGDGVAPVKLVLMPEA